MIQEGQVVLFKFPQADLPTGKLRPALVVRQLPGQHDDWLICMISTQMSQRIADFDEVINKKDANFGQSGLRTESVIRISRLAVVHRTVLLGSIGAISPERLSVIRRRLSKWLQGA